MGLALGFLLVAAAMQGGLTVGLDDAGLRAAAGLRHPILTTLMLGVTFLGSGNALFPLAVLIGAVLWRRGPRWTGYYLLAAMAGWALSSSLKALFARPRPRIVPHLDGAGWWSFPSGHTMESTVVLGLGILLLTEALPNRTAVRWIQAIGLALLAAIGLSRVYLGVHYPSDVLGGWLAGGAWIAGVFTFFSASRAELHPPSPPGSA